MKLKLLLSLSIALFSLTIFSQTINEPSNYEACDTDGDGFVTIDLTVKDAEILGDLDPSEHTITYHITQADADTGNNALTNPYTNTSNPELIYVRVEENATGNFATTYLIIVANSLIIEGFSLDVRACDENDIDGITTFNLSLFDEEYTNGEPNLLVTYHHSYSEAEQGINAIANPSNFVNTVPYSQTVYVRIQDVDTDCFFASQNTSLILNVNQEAIIVEPTPYVICDVDDDGFEVFDLSFKDDEILGTNDPNFYNVSYFETITDADNNVNPLPVIYTNTTPFAQTIFARVADDATSCYQVTNMELIVESDCISVSSATIDVCGDNPNIPILVDLTSEELNMINNQDPIGFSFSYFYTESDAQNEINSIANPMEYEVSGSSSVVYVRIEDNNSSNFAIVELVVNFSLAPQIDFEEFYAICDGEEIDLYPGVSSSSGDYSFLWNTGETTSTIVVSVGGTYSVTVTNVNNGCESEASVDVIESESPILEPASDVIGCGPDSVFDLTTVIPEILNGQEPNLFIINFFNDLNAANFNNNAITNPTSYESQFATESMYVRVQNIDNECYSLVEFNVVNDSDCADVVTCGEEPLNNIFCYSNNDTSVYRYESSDNSPLLLVFVEGQVENNLDALIVLDSDGVTNLNPTETTYGNGGNLAGLSFVSTGNSISFLIDADGSIACVNQNYDAINYNVSCLDTEAIPECNITLTQPLDGAIDVDENADLSWNPPYGIVTGYKLSVGTTLGGVELFDNLDVGNVLTYDVGILEYETTYYLTITAYNENGDAIDCTEKSFTTKDNPNQTVVCEDGPVNTIHCYDNDESTVFNFQSSDGSPLTIFFNSGSTEFEYDLVTIIDSDGTILNPNLPFGNNGDFTGLSYSSVGSTISVQFESDNIISCASGEECCTDVFDFDVYCTSTVGIIDVNAFLDANLNSSFDTDELNYTNGFFTYERNSNGIVNTVNSSNGNFKIVSDNNLDEYEITFNLYDETADCFNITTTVFSNISVSEGDMVTLDFPVTEAQSCEDLSVILLNYTAPPRPGFDFENYLVLQNLGSTNIASGTVEYITDPVLVFNSVVAVNPNYTITNTSTGFTLDFVNLQPGETEYITVSLTCPVEIELGDLVTNSAIYLTGTNDLYAENNYSTLLEEVVGSWDPNDKMESHGRAIFYDDFVTSDEYLYYTIRFQNLGTAEAITVRIEDVLDNQFDETSFQMLRSSHDYVVTKTNNTLEWVFDDINLPAEQDDAEGSNGFVYFKIKPNAGYAIGDIIPNSAAIYFDFNAPVITNTFETEFVEENLSVSEFNFSGFELFPNPAKELLTIKMNTVLNGTVSIYDLQGKEILKQTISEENSIEINVSDLQSGLYFVKLHSESVSVMKKLIIE